jgi:nucleotide-binding universal stress UspA family protein
MRVALALDGTETGMRALAATASWLQTTNAELVVIHVLKEDEAHETARGSKFTHALTPYGMSSGQSLNVVEPITGLAEDRSQAIARVRSEWIEKLKDEVAAQVPGLAATAVVHVSDHVADAIVESAREANAEVIVVGTHGRTGLSHAILGSVADRVVREATVPVLVVGPKVASAS